MNDRPPGTGAITRGSASPGAGRRVSSVPTGPPRAPRHVLAAGNGAAGERGLFGPGSVTWRINRENVLVLGGGRALILQVAHPLVGAGVEQHSNYDRDPWGRLFRTLDLTTAVVFGTIEDAERAAGRVWKVHGRVRGVTEQAAGRFPAGTPYDARDPELAMWVAATLIDTSLLMYDRYVAPVSLPEREAYYEEQKTFAEMFGVPREQIPPTYADFQSYFRTTAERDLAVNRALEGVVEATLERPALPAVALPARPLMTAAARLVTVGELPARLREELGLAWGRPQERLRAGLTAVIRSSLRLTPPLVREFPRARAARRRLPALAGN